MNICSIFNYFPPRPYKVRSWDYPRNCPTSRTTFAENLKFIVLVVFDVRNGSKRIVTSGVLVCFGLILLNPGGGRTCFETYKDGGRIKGSFCARQVIYIGKINRKNFKKQNPLSNPSGSDFQGPFLTLSLQSCHRSSGN